MIRINDTYSITADKFGYALTNQTDYKNKKGKPITENVAYGGTVKAVLQSAMHIKQLEVIDSEDMTLSEAIKAFDRIKDEYAKLLNVISEEID